MVSQDRQKVIETNRSLRIIKNELESLLEKGVIAEDAFDHIHQLLPAESSLSAAPTPAQQRTAVSAPPPPASALQNLHLRDNDSSSNNNNDNSTASATPSSPPSYAPSAGGPPALPGRSQPPPPPPQARPVLVHARALYRYAASDARDCALERDDRIAVYEYMNADWWMGRNLRSGQEGIFPRTYVEVDHQQPPPPQQPPYHDEKAAAAAAYGAPPVYGGAGGGGYPGAAVPYGNPGPGGAYPPPPGPVNPYNANVPPMAVAEQGDGGQGSSGGHGKMGEQGKKFGKKLGNAAIFGAGATIGSNIVNSIF